MYGHVGWQARRVSNAQQVNFDVQVSFLDRKSCPRRLAGWLERNDPMTPQADIRVRPRPFKLV
jgi:hypothetical protein